MYDKAESLFSLVKIRNILNESGLLTTLPLYFAVLWSSVLSRELSHYYAFKKSLSKSLQGPKELASFHFHI